VAYWLASLFDIRLVWLVIEADFEVGQQASKAENERDLVGLCQEGREGYLRLPLS